MRGYRASVKWKQTHGLKRNANAYVSVYMKRGKIAKEPCETCGSELVKPWHADYSRPLEVRWFCSAHFAEHEAKFLASNTRK